MDLLCAEDARVGTLVFNEVTDGSWDASGSRFISQRQCAASLLSSRTVERAPSRASNLTIDGTTTLWRFKIQCDHDADTRCDRLIGGRHGEEGVCAVSPQPTHDALQSLPSTAAATPATLPPLVPFPSALNGAGGYHGSTLRQPRSTATTRNRGAVRGGARNGCPTPH